MKNLFPTLVALTMLLCLSQVQAQTVFSESGATGADITDTVDAFRNDLGALNPFAPVNVASGRRQVNWDAAPDFISAPNAFPGDFFNFSSSPRARGIEFSTPGSGFQLSATAESGQGTDFSNLNSQYGEIFEAFSPQRLFTPIQSNITDVSFFNPSDQTTAATTHGFGVVFSDVDYADTTSIELFDRLDNSLGLYFADNYTSATTTNANEHFSFLGISYVDSIIGRVRITTGTDPLIGLENTSAGIDLVTMDDVIFGEPQSVGQAVPEPGSAALLMLGFLATSCLRRRS